MKGITFDLDVSYESFYLRKTKYVYETWFYYFDVIFMHLSKIMISKFTHPFFIIKLTESFLKCHLQNFIELNYEKLFQFLFFHLFLNLTIYTHSHLFTANFYVIWLNGKNVINLRNLNQVSPSPILNKEKYQAPNKNNACQRFWSYLYTHKIFLISYCFYF